MSASLTARKTPGAAIVLDLLGGVLFALYIVLLACKLYSMYVGPVASVPAEWLSGWALVAVAFIAVLMQSVSGLMMDTRVDTARWASYLFVANIAALVVTFVVVVVGWANYMIFG